MKVRLPGILVMAALIGGGDSVHAAPAGEVRIAPEDCRRLVQHRPDPDVAYTPGVDVRGNAVAPADQPGQSRVAAPDVRSEEHTSELQSLMRISYAVFCLKKKKHDQQIENKIR